MRKRPQSVPQYLHLCQSQSSNKLFNKFLQYSHKYSIILVHCKSHKPSKIKKLPPPRFLVGTSDHYFFASRKIFRFRPYFF